ncbi:CDP-alcohol phosphatidyltransferase family protein [Photobacterium chitinilyticum]|uniref:CDP-diacylglycerol--glycerol-3-phosphate 3-phosphatidyltransferase n=1 Tax=Photobacterium chitinilyticum TaxID=2485123 RepID=A0A3S3RGF2_9GAMM|nr:CDP-alcohol phosphatidyltransferase family protein [Photobacterium chitinilyticum]RWX54673.1 CDP-alcohol phosphatidyltransferase family protein [Photobacterium chitinilyticum]
MAYSVIKQIPNILTTLRLLLAVPICLLILDRNYPTVLWIAFIAGLSDAADGWLARKLNALTRFGAIADPLSDKALLISAYVAFAIVGLVPVWVAAIIIVRDVIIIIGATAYHWWFGRYEIAPSFWGKANTFIQITYALMLLTHQVYPIFPSLSFHIGLWLLLSLVVISGGHYIYTWGRKARINLTIN